eukprot:4236198-Amphidinium_carterae.2
MIALIIPYYYEHLELVMPCSMHSDKPVLVSRSCMSHREFLRSPYAASHRQLYSEAVRELLQPRQSLHRARDEVLARVPYVPSFRHNSVKECPDMLMQPLRCRSKVSQLIGVHKRVDNPGSARMQFAQVMPATDAFIEAVKKLGKRRGCADFWVLWGTVVRS